MGVREGGEWGGGLVPNVAKLILGALRGPRPSSSRNMLEITFQASIILPIHGKIIVTVIILRSTCNKTTVTLKRSETREPKIHISTIPV